jgi:hypothetical protein
VGWRTGTVKAACELVNGNGHGESGIGGEKVEKGAAMINSLRARRVDMGWNQTGELQNFEDVRLGGNQQNPLALTFRSLCSEQQNLQPCAAHVFKIGQVHVQTANIARQQILKRQPVGRRGNSIEAADNFVAGRTHAATMKW